MNQQQLNKIHATIEPIDGTDQHQVRVNIEEASLTPFQGTQSECRAFRQGIAMGIHLAAGKTPNDVDVIQGSTKITPSK